MKQESKMYSQTEIADLIGISKATVSRYLKKHNVTATTKNNAKLYPETILHQTKNAQKGNNTNNKEHVSTIQLLQDQIAQLKVENKTLREQLKIKDEQIKSANKLADQAQSLNLLDKKEIQSPAKKHWWQK